MNEQRFNELCRRRGFDAAVATTPVNVFYSSGFLSLGQKFISGTKVFSLAIPGSPPRVTVVLPVGESDLAVEEVHRAVELWPYGEFFIEGLDPQRPGADGRLSRMVGSSTASSAVEALVGLFRQAGLNAARIAVDENGLTSQEWVAISERCAGVIQEGSAFWKDVRMVKTAEEVDNLRTAATLTSRAMDHALTCAREGMTEKELQRAYEVFLLEHGAGTAVSVVLFGEHSAYPNGLPGDRKLKRGDIIRFDAGCTYNDYYSDLARVAVFGTPDAAILEKIRRYHAAALAGAEQAIRVIRPGVRANQLYETAVETVRKAGIPHFRRTHCGHGIGAEMYDPPVLRRTVDTELEPGMVFCVETPYYEMGLGGIQVEDTVVVTSSGVEYLCPPSTAIEVIG